MKIIPYQPQYRQYFEQINRAWLEKYFKLEPIDEYVLTNPEEAIINPGGHILFAEHEGGIIGAIALRWLDNSIEITKMGVTEASRGLGAGKLLLHSAVQLARELKPARIILYSNTMLETAIAIYRNYGFIEIPLEKGMYTRSDIKMELPL